MRPSHPPPSLDVEPLLSTGARVRIVRLLCLRSENMHAISIAQETKLTKQAVSRTMKELEQTGVVVRSGWGRVVMFQINKKHPMAVALRTLFLSEQDCRQQLQGIAHGVAVYFHPYVKAGWLRDFGNASYELLLGVDHAVYFVNETSAQQLLDRRISKFRVTVRVRMILMKDEKARKDARQVYRAYFTDSSL